MCLLNCRGKEGVWEERLAVRVIGRFILKFLFFGTIFRVKVGNEFIRAGVFRGLSDI